MDFFVGGGQGVGSNPLTARLIRLGGIAGELMTFGRDRATGRIGPGHEPVFIDKKIIEVGLEKVLGKNPMTGAGLDLLFDGDKANKRSELPPGMNPDGTPRVLTPAVGADEPAPPVTMLPMWNADP